MFDVYKNKKHPAERMVTRPGAGLPDHVSARDWALMSVGALLFMDYVEEDVVARGFSYFELT